MDDALDPLIHQVTRLRLMTLLVKNREAPFTWLQERLSTTPGNLYAHVERLVGAGYVGYGKRLLDAGFEARVWITPQGDRAFRAYLGDLQRLLAAAEAGDVATPAADPEGT